MERYDNSMLDCFRHDCEAKYYYRYIKHLQNINEQAASIYGKAIHSACDSFFLAAPLEIALENFDNLCPSDLDTKRTVQTGHELIRAYYKKWENQPFDNILSIEKSIKLDFDDFEFWGKLDKLVQWYLGITPIDHKTTSLYLPNFMRSQRESYQFSGYIKIVKQLFSDACGLLIDAIYIPNRLKSGKLNLDNVFDRVMITRSEFALNEWEEWVKRTVDLIRQAIETNTFQKFRSSCGNYNKECPYMQLCDLECPIEEAANTALNLANYVIQEWKPWENSCA